jgi:hypothetical protein
LPLDQRSKFGEVLLRYRFHSSTINYSSNSD